MGRKILAVIAGYLSAAVLIFITFSLFYMILGTEGSFQPNSYRVSTVWIIAGILLNIIAALIGGYICMLIAKDSKTVLVLAAIIFILGIIMAIPSLGGYNEVADLIRDGSLSNMEAMEKAKQPDFILFLNPVLGAIGVWLGGKLWKEKKTPQVKPA